MCQRIVYLRCYMLPKWNIPNYLLLRRGHRDLWGVEVGHGWSKKCIETCTPKTSIARTTITHAIISKFVNRLLECRPVHHFVKHTTHFWDHKSTAIADHNLLHGREDIRWCASCHCVIRPALKKKLNICVSKQTCYRMSIHIITFSILLHADDFQHTGLHGNIQYSLEIPSLTTS